MQHLNNNKVSNYKLNLFKCIWGGLKFFCYSLIDTDCSYEEFVNTVILTNDTSCNGITQYACESGYRLTSGNLSRVCDIGQQWIGDPPVCSGKIIILIK